MITQTTSDDEKKVECVYCGGKGVVHWDYAPIGTQKCRVFLICKGTGKLSAAK